MHTYRVNIFHIADCDAVTYTVTHYLIFNFFPSGNTTLYQNLTYTGKTKSVFQDFTKLCFIVGNTATASAKCVGRAENYRIADRISESQSIFYCGNNLGSSNRFSDLLHSVLKFLTVLGLLNSLSSGTDQSYIMFF